MEKYKQKLTKDIILGREEPRTQGKMAKKSLEGLPSPTIVTIFRDILSS